MVVDRNGRTLSVGDTVTITAIVVALTDDETATARPDRASWNDHANVSVRLEVPLDSKPRVMTVGCKQVAKV